jgi:hypothetical protein
MTYPRRCDADTPTDRQGRGTGRRVSDHPNNVGISVVRSIDQLIAPIGKHKERGPIPETLDFLLAGFCSPDLITDRIEPVKVHFRKLILNH